MADVVDVVIVDEGPINMSSSGTSPPLPFARGGHRCAVVGASTAREDVPVVAVANVFVLASPVEAGVPVAVADVVFDVFDVCVSRRRRDSFFCEVVDGYV